MGAVFRPKDLGRGQRKVIENAIKDLSPDTKNNIIKLLDSWEDSISSKEKLKQILGQEKAEELLKNIKAKEEGINLTKDERKRLSDMFKESLTFD